MTNPALKTALARQLVEDRLRDAARAQSASRMRENRRLLKRAASGDVGAWRKLVERFGPRVRATARGCGLGSEDVADVEQITWMRLVEGAGAIRDPGALGAWLETTARRESLRTREKALRECPTVSDALPEAAVEPVAEQHVIDAERSGALRAAMERLPARQREILTAVTRDEPPTYDQLAAALGIPIGSIG